MNKINIDFRHLHVKFGAIATLMVLISFFVNYFLFGVNVALIGAIVSLLYVLIPNNDININPVVKFTYLLFIMSVVVGFGMLAKGPLWLSFIVNLCIPFILVYKFSTIKNMKGYLLYYFLFIMTQIGTGDVKDFPKGMMAIATGLIIGNFIYKICNKNNKKSERVSLIYYIKDKQKEKKKSKSLILGVDKILVIYGVILSVATAFSFVFWRYLDFEHWYWIGIVTCFTISPVRGETLSKIFIRIYGTLFGVLLFLILSTIITNKIILGVTVLISIFLLLSYLPLQRQVECNTFGTYVALVFATFTLSVSMSISCRVAYTLIGSAVTAFILMFTKYLSNKYLKNLN